MSKLALFIRIHLVLAGLEHGIERWGYVGGLHAVVGGAKGGKLELEDTVGEEVSGFMYDVETRDVLRNATSISLSLDESKYVKVVRYRADVPAPGGGVARNVGASGYCHAGVLGILDCKKSHAAEFEEDHAATAVKQLGSFLTKFCTSMGGAEEKQCLWRAMNR